jgi:hypothetical protein
MADFDWESATPVDNKKPEVSETRKVLEQAAEGPMQDIVSALPWAQAATGFAPLVGQPSGYGIDSSQALDAMRRVFGISGQQPETVGGKALGAGLRAVTSPSTYSVAPLFGMTGPVSTAVSAGGGAAGAELLGEYLGFPGYVIGAIAGSAPGQWAGSGKRLFSEIRNASQTGGAVNDFANTVGSKRAATVAQKAFESDSNLAANLLRAREIEQLTGVTLPTNAAAQGSNVLIQEMRSQAAQNPAFLDAIRQQEAKAQKDIFARATRLFGEPNPERVVEATKNQASAVKTLNRRIVDIDTQLSKLGQNVDMVDPEQLGNRITNLVKAKEEIARKEVSPLYENALTNAETNGIKLNPDQTQSIYDFVNSSVNKDTFKTFPAIYSKVLSKFKPEVVGEGDNAVDVFKEASVRDLDSLKREINKALRGDASADTRRVLNNLKTQVGSVVDELPSDFSDAYRAADAEYLKKVGIPFAAKAIDDIGGKGFVEQTVPVLTKNPSALRQFIDVAGQDAQPIIRDSFMYDLSKIPNIVDETGALNVKVLDRFINKNRNTLKVVPDVEAELNGLRNDSRQLVNTRTRVAELLKTEQKREADSLFNKVNNQGLDVTINSFLSAPAQQTTILKQLNQNSEAMKGFRAAVTEKMLEGGSPLEFYTANQRALDKLYGPTYTENVKALAEAAQALASNPVKLNVPISTIRKTKFEEATGMSPESTVALARRQITSNFQKVTIGLSKFFQNQANEAEKKAIQEFLQDPKKIQEAAQFMKEINMTQDLPKIRKLVNTFSAEIGRRGAYGLNIALDTEFGNPQQSNEAVQPEQLDFSF